MIFLYTTFCITFALGICLCRHDLWREQWPDRHWHKHLEDLHATYINMYIPHHIYGFSIIWNRNNLKPPQLPFGRKHDGYQTAASFSCAEKRLEEAGWQDDWRLLILTAYRHNLKPVSIDPLEHSLKMFGFDIWGLELHLGGWEAGGHTKACCHAQGHPGRQRAADFGEGGAWVRQRRWRIKLRVSHFCDLFRRFC